ncbi:4-hydroxy-tetrahydrodipicolinate reductase [Alteribacillus bidgolensis]|uniref:4-hydroxy-tetrahydrodipicolinate reductase n=1 Tax=Alteribacillus bidgolensis TaxID=930129 RepID=A0A1G8C7V0_9BACI|nr:4-hydroxy-tetrahydrodipicolinate reductase [Alteribacillus bidgolensis]SDH41607.1 dihydrodipicolinate reductase [Alteribacillus bidgolensis]
MAANTKIIIAGPRGKMGKEAVHLVHETEEFQLVAAVDSKNNGLTIKELPGMPDENAFIYDDMQTCLEEMEADVLIDLTTPTAGKHHLELALDHHVRPVVGTTGFTPEDITRLRKKAEEKEIGAIIAPNFAVGAVLMMKFSQMAAKYFSDVEIIEMHHDNKLDAPSGTAAKTAALINEVRPHKEQGHPEEQEELEGARGAQVDGLRVHSVRLPGLVAHQEVMFGGSGQTLTIRHDSINRQSFMPGVKLAVENVLRVNTLVYGLENIME